MKVSIDVVFLSEQEWGRGSEMQAIGTIQKVGGSPGCI